MADTIRTIAELQAMLANNTTGAISEQDLRDMLVSLANAYQTKYTSGWKDLIAPLNAAKLAGASDPTWSAFGADSSQRAYKFALNNEVNFHFHVPHDIKPGSQALFHVHLATSSTSTNTVKWELTYSYATSHGQMAFPNSTTITIEEAASSTPWMHEVVGDAAGPTISEPDGLILCKLKRVTNGGVENTDDVFGLFVDLHYQSDRDSTIWRAPDFFTAP